jgi:hypothetical protein
MKYKNKYLLSLAQDMVAPALYGKVTSLYIKQILSTILQGLMCHYKVRPSFGLMSLYKHTIYTTMYSLLL